jgi:annexin A7/11
MNLALTPAEIEQQVVTLQKAMKGFGTDEKSLISVLGKFNDYQMQQIVVGFKASYAKDLEKELEKETGGDFRKLCLALVRPCMEQDASIVEKAIKGSNF